MRLPATFSVLLLALAATPASGDGEVQPLKLGKPAGVKALDTVTLTSGTSSSESTSRSPRTSN